MTALLALALVAPIAAIPIAWRAPAASTARRWTGAAALGVATAWLLLLAAPDTSVGRFGARHAVVAAAAALLAAPVTWPTRRLSVGLLAVVVLLVAGGAALLGGDGDLADAAGALALAAAVALVATRTEGDGGVAAAAVALVGSAAIALGLVRLEAHTGTFEQGGGLLAVVGACLVAAAAASRARRVLAVLLPLALLLGVQAGVVLDNGAAAVALAIAALAAAAAMSGFDASALALWSIAAAVATGAAPAALLLAAAAVLVTVVGHPIARLAALPGAAALAVAFGDGGISASVGVAPLAFVTVWALWRDRDDVEATPGAPSWPTSVALALGAWLVAAPETWGWVGDADLTGWGVATGVTAVAAAVGFYVAASLTDDPITLPPLEIGDPVYTAVDGRRARVAAVVALGILGVSSAALVASVLT